LHSSQTIFYWHLIWPDQGLLSTDHFLIWLDQGLLSVDQSLGQFAQVDEGIDQ